MAQTVKLQSTRLNTKTGVPLYRQLENILSGQIHGGTLAPGDSVPGEHELAQRFDVSRITARRALTELANEGLVVRERGRGTKVADAPPMPTLHSSVEGWLENARQMAEATTVKVLSFDYVAAPNTVAAAMALEEGTLVQRAVRVRSLGDEPFSYLETCVPEHIGRCYDQEDMGTKPLLELLEEADVRVAAARQTISAASADVDVAAALSIYAGSPLLSVTRVVMDDSDAVVQYICALYRPEMYKFSMTMERVQRAEGRAWSAGTTPVEMPVEDRRSHG